VRVPDQDIEKLAERISKNVDPIKILVKKILKTESTLIMNEATKAIKNLSKNPFVIQNLFQEGSLINIVKTKFIDTDP
jgi:hypothetical protein